MSATSAEVTRDLSDATLYDRLGARCSGIEAAAPVPVAPKATRART